MTAEIVIPLAMFAFGALAGLASKWWPLSGWIALALPLLVPPLGIALAQRFC